MNTTASVPNGTNGTTSKSTSTSSANHATRTILRIKRRRTEHPIPCIRLEGLVDNPGASEVSATGGKVSRKRQQHEEEGEPSREASRRASSSKRSSAAMWKRVLHDDSNENNNDGNVAWNANDNNTGSYRIVDAVFTNTNTNAGRTGEAGEGFGGGEAANGPSSNKRRKLTLLDCSTVVSEESPLLWSLGKNPAEQSRTRTRRKAPLKVLDPWTRIVDDQLRSVQQGTTTPEAHYRQLTTDPKFTFRDSVEKRRYLGWRLEDGTNLLHCCALWNDPSTASEVLRTCGQGSWTNPASASNARSEWMEQVDGDGRTPYELAKLIGHDRVCEVLEVYGGDTSNYVYDVFYLENNDDSDNNVHEASNGNPAGSGDGGTISEPLGYVDAYGNNNILTAELSSGVGYWTPEGDLVFETATDDDPSGRFQGNNDGYDDDDADSNCEDHGANDYPEHDADEFDLQHQHGYNDYRGYHPSNNLDREDAESNGNYGGTPDGYGRYGWDHGYHNPGDHDEYDDGYGECEYEYDWEQDLH